MGLFNNNSDKNKRVYMRKKSLRLRPIVNGFGVMAIGVMAYTIY